MYLISIEMKMYALAILRSQQKMCKCLVMDELVFDGGWMETSGRGNSKMIKESV